MQPLTIRCSNCRQWHGRRGGPATVAPPPFSIATTSGHGVTASQTEEGGGAAPPQPLVVYVQGGSVSATVPCAPSGVFLRFNVLLWEEPPRGLGEPPPWLNFPAWPA